MTDPQKTKTDTREQPITPNPNQPPIKAVLFDLDGVLTDTADLHYQSWQTIARQLKIPFNRQANNALRGLGRRQSLDILLGNHQNHFSDHEKNTLTQQKNDDYLKRVARMTPNDLLPGVRPILDTLEQRNIPRAVASSSKNAIRVLDQLGIRHHFHAVIDGNEITASKPAPDVFLAAARALNTPPRQCLVIEDAQAGILAAKAAGMRVVGIGPPERTADADHAVTCLTELNIASFLTPQ